MSKRHPRARKQAYNRGRELRLLISQFSNLRFWLGADEATQDQLLSKAHKKLDNLRDWQRKRVVKERLLTALTPPKEQ